MTAENPNNMLHVASNCYIVTTQAGFRKALKQYCKEYDFDSYKDADLCGYPKAYPAMVFFSIQYRGYHYVEADCFPVSAVEIALHKLLKRIRQRGKPNAESSSSNRSA